jgi:predicted O-methyltransferase YrrM
VIPYPTQLDVRGPNAMTVQMVHATGARNVAEIGVYRGATSRVLARILPIGGSLDLFDFEEVVDRVAAECRAVARCSVRVHGCSSALRDSYCWPLGQLVQHHAEPIWDYVFVDGAHTWDIDALAVVLASRLLRVGGYIDLDDYEWTMDGSAAVSGFPTLANAYTAEQKATKQVAMIADVFLRRGGFEEVVRNKVWRKASA